MVAAMTSPLSVATITLTPDDLVRLIAQGVADGLAALRGTSAAPTDGEWVDTRGAAALLGISRRQVQNLATARKGAAAALPSKRVGKLLRFRRSDVLAQLESQ